MRFLPLLLLLVWPTLASASPLAFAIRGEQVWTETKWKSSDDWTDDVLLSVVGDYRLLESQWFLTGRFGHLLDAGKKQGAFGLEYRFTEPCPETKPAKVVKRKYDPCRECDKRRRR